MLVLAQEVHDQLTIGELGVAVGIIAACCALVLLAGFGYFTFGGDGDEGSGH